MYLRFGTVLKLFQDYFDESIREFSKRINMAPATVNAYIKGHRFPSKEISQSQPDIQYTLNSFLYNSLKELEMKPSQYNVKYYVMNILTLEKKFRTLTKSSKKSINKASTNLLLAYLKEFYQNNPDCSPETVKVDKLDCIKSLFQEKNISKDAIALYLTGEKYQNLFFELEDNEDLLFWPEFRNIEEIYNFCKRNGALVSWETSIDVLMSLPDKILLNIDNSNDYELSVELIDKNIQSTPFCNSSEFILDNNR
ncbi:hypothetical protein Nther_1987 [Natranaerobius thermophilus JW/NM-WN-LF]|uniref:Uncharacterized protein n=1 Tax=Natranaerobius thermophilus (strain ATCC BAA-1301 / DSM 18059 / JW/NM-WN-LF) TaxID=457570 RepID=B2A6M1_NATTJ|nr:hypothetical protein Nther_1987 [Natranaerobius thermophilus JW/NM-WN-LF]